MRQAARSVGHIGSNAIVQLAAVLRDRAGALPVQRLFEAAGMARYLDAMPEGMVDEVEVRVLHATLRRQFGPACAQALARAAGRRAAAQLLERRVPEPARWVIARLPKPLAVRLLLEVIERNAAAFCGSGTLVTVHGRPARLGITRNPLARGLKCAAPACDYHAGKFEALFRTLIDPEARLREVACEAMGDAACVFELDW